MSQISQLNQDTNQSTLFQRQIGCQIRELLFVYLWQIYRDCTYIFWNQYKL